MTPKIFPRGSKVKLGGRDPPKKFFSKSEDVGEIMQNYYKSDLCHPHHNNSYIKPGSPVLFSLPLQTPCPLQLTKHATACGQAN